MGGGFDFIGDVIDTGADFLGDVGSTIGDVAGDVVGGIGDLVGSLDLADAAKAFIMSGGNPYAAAIAATGIDESLGFNPGSFMSGDFTDFGGGMDVGGGGFDFSAPDFSSMDFGDYNQLGEAFDTTTSVLDNLPNLGQNLGDIIDYSQYYNPEIGTTFSENLGPITDYYKDYNPEIGTTFSENLGAFPQIDTSTGGGLFETAKGGLDKALEWYKKYGNMAGAVGKLITSYYAGKLSREQQEELNRKIQAEYDAYNAKKSGFASQIASGQLPQLNISRGTYSPVRKYNPVFAANGGAIRNRYGTGGITELIASLTMPSMEDILKGYEKYGDPIAQLLKYGLSYGAGKLSKKQQEEFNKLKQAQYDKYNEEKSAFSDLIASGNLPSLNISRGTTPVVKAAMGGIMNTRPRINMGIMGVNR